MHTDPHVLPVQFPCGPPRPSKASTSADRALCYTSLHMDKDTKDILETVNFIKDHMATKDDLSDLRNEMHDGFAAINRRLDHIIQMQLDEHAMRIKKLEAAVFSK
jgi:hypothetical protein